MRSVEDLEAIQETHQKMEEANSSNNDRHDTSNERWTIISALYDVAIT